MSFSVADRISSKVLPFIGFFFLPLVHSKQRSTAVIYRDDDDNTLAAPSMAETNLSSVKSHQGQKTITTYRDDDVADVGSTNPSNVKGHQQHKIDGQNEEIFEIPFHRLDAITNEIWCNQIGCCGLSEANC